MRWWRLLFGEYLSFVYLKSQMNPVIQVCKEHISISKDIQKHLNSHKLTCKFSTQEISRDTLLDHCGAYIHRMRVG